MIYSTLHSVSQVLVLAGLLSVFSTTLIVWLKLRKHMREEWAKSRQIASASGENSSSKRTHITMIDHWPVVLIAVSSFLLGAYIGDLNGEFHRQNFDEMHDIRILDRTDPYTFRMEIDDPDTHAPRSFGVRFCPDYEPTHEFQPGVTIAYLKYERHDFEDCWEIGKKHLGYGLRRDKNAKPILFHTR